MSRGTLLQSSYHIQMLAMSSYLASPGVGDQYRLFAAFFRCAPLLGLPCALSPAHWFMCPRTVHRLRLRPGTFIKINNTYRIIERATVTIAHIAGPWPARRQGVLGIQGNENVPPLHPPPPHYHPSSVFPVPRPPSHP